MNTDQIMNLIDKVTHKLSMPAHHLMAIYVRQVYVQAFSDLFLSAIFIVFMIAIGWGMLFYIKRIKEDLEESAFFIILLGVCLVALFICIVCAWDEALTYLINPQYAAIQILMSTFK